MLHDIAAPYLAAEGPGSDTFLVALVTTTGAVLVSLIPIVVRKRSGKEVPAEPKLSLFEQDLVNQRDAARADLAAARALVARLGRWVGYYREKMVKHQIDPGPDVTEEQDPPP